MAPFRPLRLATLLKEGDYVNEEEKKLVEGSEENTEKDGGMMRKVERLRKEQETWNELTKGE